MHRSARASDEDEFKALIVPQKKNTTTQKKTYIRDQIQPLHDLRVVVRPEDGTDLRHGPRVPGVDVWAAVYACVNQ
jgi:hypothetical protein